MGLSAFKNINKDLVDGLSSSGQKVGLGIHNSLLQMGNTTYSTAGAWGAGIGAAYGAIDGGLSYDGSILGGAFHGAMLGGAAGAGLRFAGETYGNGAISSEFASGKLGSFANAWTPTGSAFRNSEGKQMGAFQTSAFKGGW